MFSTKILSWVTGSLAVLVVVIATGFYFYFNETQSHIANLSGQLRQAEISLAGEKLKVTKLTSDISEIKSANDRLLGLERRLRADLQRTETRLRALMDTAKSDPIEATRQVSRIIAYRIQCMALVTGGSIDEIDRKDGYVNPICPQYFNQVKP